MKIRTINDLQDAIDAEMAWRKHELSAIRANVDGARNFAIGRIYQLIGNEYFPRDHVYAVHSVGNTRYIRIKIK